MIRRPPRSPLFPSTTLFRSEHAHHAGALGEAHAAHAGGLAAHRAHLAFLEAHPLAVRGKKHHVVVAVGQGGAQDRKSTRLNSSHLVISYAVFCLKKIKTTRKSKSENCCCCRCMKKSS